MPHRYIIIPFLVFVIVGCEQPRQATYQHSVPMPQSSSQQQSQPQSQVKSFGDWLRQDSGLYRGENARFNLQQAQRMYQTYVGRAIQQQQFLIEQDRKDRASDAALEIERNRLQLERERLEFEREQWRAIHGPSANPPSSLANTTSNGPHKSPASGN